MSEGGRQARPGHAPEAGELRDANDETFVPGEAQKDRGWALNDRMRMVRAERQGAASQIHRSMTAWRKESGAGGEAAAQAKIPKSGGAPLGSDVRKSMEGRLGADLSGVKVHTGGEAAGAAEGLRARAFTVGEDVHFGAGEYAPGTKEGDRLLAHELTHVVQGQRSGIQRKADDGAGHGGADAKGGGAAGGHEVSQPGDPAEKEADAVADKVADGMHGDKKGDKGKGPGKDKSKGKDKKAAKGGHGDDDNAEDGEHGEHEGEEHGGGAHGDAKGGGGGAQADAKGAGGGGDVKQAPVAQISAKLISRKIFRDPKKGAGPAPAPGANPATPANSSAAGSGPSAEQQKKEAEIDARITKERAAIAAAGSLGALGAVIAGTAKAGKAAIKLNNTEASVKRATAAFTAAAKTDPMMASAQAEFVDSRYGKAVQGQKNGILAEIDKMKALKGTPKFADVDYDGAQWTATLGMDPSVTLPENLNAGSADASAGAAKSKGGIIKLFGMGAFFGTMEPKLKEMWKQVYGGDERAARAAWTGLSNPLPATCPPPGALADKAKNTLGLAQKDFAKFGSLDAAFTKPVTGSVGFADDYSTINSIKAGVDQLGLRAEEYVGGGFIAKIPTAQLDGALGKANEAQGGAGAKPNAKNILGKPSLFTSLLFAEFNYIVEDRVTNTTAVNDTSNSGAKDKKGKDELAVVKMPISEFLAGGLTYLPG